MFPRPKTVLWFLVYWLLDYFSQRGTRTKDRFHQRGIVRAYLRISLLFSICCLGYLSAQTLTIFSGNGQVVQEQFRTNVPLVVQAKDAAGNPAAGVAIAWKIPANSGTLSGPVLKTDANGLASTNFVATAVPPGQSFIGSTVTASSASGTVTFFITTALGAEQGHFLAPPPPY